MRSIKYLAYFATRVEWMNGCNCVRLLQLVKIDFVLPFLAHHFEISIVAHFSSNLVYSILYDLILITAHAWLQGVYPPEGSGRLLRR